MAQFHIVYFSLRGWYFLLHMDSAMIYFFIYSFVYPVFHMDGSMSYYYTFSE